MELSSIITTMLWVSPILLILVYVTVRVGSAAFFRSKRDYIRRLLHGNGPQQQDEHSER